MAGDLKTAAPGVAHKSEVGGVHLGLDGPERLAAAYAELAGRLGPRVLVAAMARLAVRSLLDGVRGAPPADLDAVAAAVVGLSELAVDLGPALAGLDVKPLVAGPGGCVAVDALVVGRASAAGPAPG